MLNFKELEILQVFSEKDCILLSELSGKFNVTERSIRYNIEKINQMLEMLGYNPIYKNEKGNYVLDKNQDLQKLRSYTYELEVFSQEERREIIKIILAFDKDGINIDLLSKKLEVSRTTSKNDFEIVKNDLKFYELEVRKKNKSGSIISGSPGNIEKFKLKLLSKYIDILYENRKRKKFEKELHRIMEKNILDINYDVIKTCIKRIIEKFSIQLSDETFKVIFSSMLIIIQRNTLEIDKNKDKLVEELFLKNTEEYRVLCKEISVIERKLNIKFHKNDLLKISDLILGVNSLSHTTEFYKNWIEIELLAKKIISIVSNNMYIDITRDKILFKCLVHHLKPTIYRIKKGIKLETIIFEQIEKDKDALYKATKKACKEIEKIIEAAIPEDELLLLVMHFKASIERNRKNPKKKVLLVCSLGYGTANLIAENIKLNYSVEIIDILPYYIAKESLKQYTNIDFIITTIDLDKNIIDKGTKFIKINPILTMEDIEKLNRMNFQHNNQTIFMSELIETIKEEVTIPNKPRLVELIESKFPNKIINDLNRKEYDILDILKPKHIKLNMHAKNWQEVIIAGGKILYEDGCIELPYIDDMLEMGVAYSDYFTLSDGVAIPHAKNEENIKKTGIVLITLDKPVAFFNGKEVDTFFIFSIFKGYEYLNAISNLVDLIFKYNIRDYILKEKSIDKIITYISKVIEKN